MRSSRATSAASTSSRCLTPDDRHVLAAAIHGGATIIVTANLRDFPAETLAVHNIEARHPDAFILELLKASRYDVLGAVRKLRQGLNNPPFTAAALLAARSRQGLSESAKALGAHSEVL